MRFSLMRLQEKNMIYRFEESGASIFQIIPHIGHHQQIIVNITPYDEIKNSYTKNNEIRGGMWNIGEKENKGMWKTTMILFGSLAVVTLFILVFSK